MGNLQGDAYAESVREGTATLNLALTAHLRSNHYPPLPLEFVQVAEKALEKAQEAGPGEEGFEDAEILDQEIEWPNIGMMPREARQDEEGKVWSTVRVALDVMHLWPFVAFDGEEGE